MFEPCLVDLFLSPIDSIIDLPNIRQSDILNIGFDFKLSFQIDLSELLLQKSVFEGVFLFNNHLLFISDWISLSFFDFLEHAIRENKMIFLRFLVNLEFLIKFRDQIIAFCQQ